MINCDLSSFPPRFLNIAHRIWIIMALGPHYAILVPSLTGYHSNYVVKLSIKNSPDIKLHFNRTWLGAKPSVCLSSVTFVRPTQLVEIFSNVFTPFCTFGIRCVPPLISVLPVYIWNRICNSWYLKFLKMSRSGISSPDEFLVSESRDPRFSCFVTYNNTHATDRRRRRQTTYYDNSRMLRCNGRLKL